MKSEKTSKVKELSEDDSAWADFLISKGALILASVVLFAALFQLAAGFKEVEAQEQLDFLARDFKAAVDETGAGSFSGGTQELSYRFDENEVFLISPFGENLEVCVSVEYVHLKAKYNEKSFSAVRPFTFMVLPFDESALRGKLHTEFGTDGREESPLRADFQEVNNFLRVSGTEEVILTVNEKISIKKEFVYIKGSEGVSAFGYVLVYQ